MDCQGGEDGKLGRNCKACGEPLTSENVHWDEIEYCVGCGEGLQKEEEEGE